MRHYGSGLAASLALLLGAVAFAGSDDAIFDADDHCVAYRTIKGMFFGFDAEVIGRSCEVTASLVTGEAGTEPRIVVVVPVESFRSGNRFRDGAVAELLGAERQPELRFTSSPIDAESLRGDVDRGHFVLSGLLTIGGTDYPVDFPLELVEHGGRHYVRGHLETTFEAFEVEVPTIAFGLVASPHEALELVTRLELEAVAGLETWAASVGLQGPRDTGS